MGGFLWEHQPASRGDVGGKRQAGAYEIYDTTATFTAIYLLVNLTLTVISFPTVTGDAKISLDRYWSLRTSQPYYSHGKSVAEYPQEGTHYPLISFEYTAEPHTPLRGFILLSRWKCQAAVSLEHSLRAEGVDLGPS